jgi:hypothetical protein
MAPLVSVAGTIGTQGRSRIEVQTPWFDILLAPQALAIGSRVDADERGIDALNFATAALIRGLGHSLRLYGIHPGQTADALLIKRDRLQGIGGLGPKLLHLPAQFAQIFTDLVLVVTHHIRFSAVSRARHYDLTGWS